MSAWSRTRSSPRRAGERHPLKLESLELALDRATRAVELPRALLLARDQRCRRSALVDPVGRAAPGVEVRITEDGELAPHLHRLLAERDGGA
jgi:hypothetical protein